MNKLQKILIEEINYYINENVQLADKVYFNTNKLTPEDKNIILGVTNGDNYTKLISDFYFILKKTEYNRPQNTLNKINELYNDVITYNKNVYPIIEYDVYNTTNAETLIYALERRRKIIKELKRLPSEAIRNMRNDIRTPRTYSELSNYEHDFEYFMGHFSLLANRDKNTQIKILRKMFKNNTTLEQLMRFVDDKENFIGGVDFTRDDIIKLTETEDLYVIYEQGNVMIVKVESPEAIKAIGCNSLWCFTYGSGFDAAYKQWYNYSHNDIVYVIINFNESSDSSDFMHVLIKPLIDDNGKFIIYDDDDDEYPIFNMSNENYSNPYIVFKYLFGGQYKSIIKKYLNFEYE
jgi:hypothetical protein